MSYKKSKDFDCEKPLYHRAPVTTPVRPSKVVEPYLAPRKPSAPPPPPPPQPTTPTLHMDYVVVEAGSGNPEVWGPAFWFSLHNGAHKYPIKATPMWKDRMKHFILGIPVMVPCEKCSIHATAYIEKNYDQLDTVVEGRMALFEFFHTFHNYVNKRLKKPEMSLQDAYYRHSIPTKTTKLKTDIH